MWIVRHRANEEKFLNLNTSTREHAWMWSDQPFIFRDKPDLNLLTKDQRCLLAKENGDCLEIKDFVFKEKWGMDLSLIGAPAKLQGMDSANQLFEIFDDHGQIAVQKVNDVLLLRKEMAEVVGNILLHYAKTGELKNV